MGKYTGKNTEIREIKKVRHAKANKIRHVFWRFSNFDDFYSVDSFRDFSQQSDEGSLQISLINFITVSIATGEQETVNIDFICSSDTL